MLRILDYLGGGLDWLFFAVVSPLFAAAGRGLEWFLLKPLDLLGIPVPWQVLVVAMFTALLSMLLRRLARVDEKEKEFKKLFSTKKEKQKDIDAIADWKTRDMFYRTTDNDIDEDFNTYLAQRFARHSAVYLLPIFLSLFWLETVFTNEELAARLGSSYPIPLPANGYGVEGLSVTFIFLAGYILSLIVLFRARRFISRNTVEKIRPAKSCELEV